MRNALEIIGGVVLGIIMLDLLILTFALLQLGIEGQTGHWSPFWAEQARFIINPLGK